jgi:carbon monoxide dehydrogenase subunit G
MEVKLDKRYAVPSTPRQAWAVLGDVHATARCMPGAQITEQIDATRYKGTVQTRIGPAQMMFNGEIEVLGFDEARHELKLSGKGADRAGSSATMVLAARIEPGDAPGNAVLVGQATVTVSGKLAQFGNRLLVPASDALLGQFADNFRAAAAAVPDDGLPSELPATREALAASTSETTVTLMVQAGQAPGAALAPRAPGTVAAPAAAAPVKPLSVFSLLWRMLRDALGRLFGRKG